MGEGPAEIDTVLFDFGGVVIRTPFELVDTDWRGPFDPEGDPLWAASMAGEITEREYWHRRSASLHPDVEDPTSAFMRDLYDTDESVVVRPELPRLLDELQGGGLRTAVLTNDLAAFHSGAWIERMTIIDRFDPLIDLSHVGFLKPSPEAFAHGLKVLDADPAQVVFLDDQPRNVEGARACGITAVWFDPTDVEGSLDALRATLR
ncbi:HAD-IA family hydrolase [Euzebya sp.]|uniref:HAD-IA family hydrolase n=1 Tax=Euzebya sp. TaxID=1971409 RepID=UPI0035175AE6